MKITWYGTASLKIETPQGKLLVDPFGKMPIGRAAEERSVAHYEEFYADCPDVLLTHGHVDHISHFKRFFGGRSARIYASKTPCQSLIRDGLRADQLCEIGPGWNGRAAGLEITAWQGRHCRFDCPLILKTLFKPMLWCHLGQTLRLLRCLLRYPENGETLFYELKGEGVRIQIMGSMSLDPQTVYPTGADVLIFPLQGRSNQDTYALQFVERLKPKQIWIDHYDNAFPPFSDEIDPSGFVRNVEQQFGIPCIPMREGECLSLEK